MRSDTSPPPDGARLTILGSGTCVPDRTRHSAAFHLEAGASRLLIDCGPGTLHGLDAFGVAWTELTHILVSHYHADHIGDLSALLFALKNGARPRRTSPLTLVGPGGFTSWLAALARSVGGHLIEPGFALRVVEAVPEAPYVDRGADFTLEVCATPHTEESLAYRVSGTWGCVGYTGDTGPSDAVARFLSACPLLIAECAYADPPPNDRHLSPVRVADLADVALPGLLVLTHVYAPLTPEEAVRRVRERHTGTTVAGRDGMLIEIGPSGARVVGDAPPAGTAATVPSP